MQTYAYGFPRIGENKEYKTYIEKYWKKEITETQLFDAIKDIQKNNIQIYNKYIDIFPDGEITFYNEILDTAVLLGIYNPQNLEEYYELCRGKNALELTKWFNTNYHYLVVDFSKVGSLKIYNNLDNPVLTFKKTSSFPHFIGPFTFLKLSKGLDYKKFKDLFFEIINTYSSILKNFKKVQIDEPAFVLDLEKEEVDLIISGYKKLDTSAEIFLMTYYGEVDYIEMLYNLPVKAIGLDFIRAKNVLNKIISNGFPQDKILVAGLVDGRNVWRNNIVESLKILKNLKETVRNIFISNASPLYHLPITVEKEENLPKDIKNILSFAREKLQEIKVIRDSFMYGSVYENVDVCEVLDKYRKEEVKQKIKNLTNKDFKKTIEYSERKNIQKEILKMPLFPTTTIGSFPQTQELREKRKKFFENKISKEEYKAYIYEKIEQTIKFQEEIGLDVLVHGEFERTDMVEFFAFNLEGFLTTKNGWVISYGTRIYRPPIIYADVYRKKSMTLDEIIYAQSKTEKPVKGMLTGPVTILAWSYVREDIPIYEVAYQIALALRDEILDYEKNNIKIVQVDEPAFREKAPIKKRYWEEYFDWAVKSFNLSTNTNPNTQIHTHMCYSEFGEIMDYINMLDFDVISIENARSKGEIIEVLKDKEFNRGIGLGVWDIHSPFPPTEEEILDMISKVLKVIPKENIWLNPDCGLKTRSWQEIKQPLETIVKVANILRSKYS